VVIENKASRVQNLTAVCVTAEHGLYGLVLLAAAVMRVANLGLIPLSPAEAGEALVAWGLWQPAVLAHSLPTFPGSPAYFSLTALISPVLGASDAVMRLVPALFGLGLVALSWWLRDFIGRVGALVFALLLAFSPAQSIAARTAGGQAIAVFAGLLLLIAWLHYQGSGRRRWFYLLLLALALGLASAPLFYGILLTLLLAWLAQAYLGPYIFVDEADDPRPLYRPDSQLWRGAAVAAAVFFLAISSFFLWYPPGLGSAVNLTAEWAAQFGLPTDLIAWLTPILALARYEPIVVVLGGAAVVWATWRGDPLPNFLVYWLTAGLGLTLVQPGAISNILLLSIPGYLLVAVLAERVLSETTGWEKWPLIGLLLFIGAVIFVNLARYGRVEPAMPETTPPEFWLAVLALAIGAMAVNLMALRNLPAARQGAVIAILVCLLVYGWGVGWRLGQVAANDPRERWVERGTDDGVRLLAAQVRQMSWRYTNSATDIVIFAAVDKPVLHWYLRDYPNLQTGHSLPYAPNHHLLITAVADDLAPSTAYAGAAFPLERLPTEQLLTFSQSVRWWFFYESPVAMNRERVILWLRGDLIREGSG
jgi:hypothetical protein